MKLAVSTLIERKFKFEEVNGEIVPFAKWNGPGGRDLSDEEMIFSPSAAFIPAGATVGVVPSVIERFNNLDFSNVNPKSPDGIPLFPEQPASGQRRKAAQAVRRREGFLRVYAQSGITHRHAAFHERRQAFVHSLF
jgi:hypothetical protein